MSVPATSFLVSAAAGRVGSLGASVLEAIGEAVGVTAVSLSGAIALGLPGSGAVTLATPLAVTLPSVAGVLSSGGIGGALLGHWDGVLTGGIGAWVAGRSVLGTGTAIGAGTIAVSVPGPIGLAGAWRVRGWTPGREVEAFEAAIRALLASIQGGVTVVGAGVPPAGAGTWVGTLT